MIFRDEILNKIFTGASASLFIRVSGVFLMFLAHALLVRAMGEYNYGIYAYAISIIPILALIAQSGFQFSSLRFLHEYNSEEGLPLKGGYIRRSFQIPLLFSSLIFVLGTLAGFYFDELPEIMGESAKYASWIIVVVSLAYIGQQMLRAMKRIVYSQVFEQVGLPLVLILLAGSFVLGESVLGYRFVFLAHGVTFLVVMLICWALVFRFAGIDFGASREYQTAEWVRVSLPLGMVGIGLVFMDRLDIIILGFFVDAEEIALYSISSRIAGLTVFCMAALSAITGPYISELHHGDKGHELKLLLRKIVFFAIVVNLLFWLFLFAFGKYLLLAFGEQFISLHTIMLILAAGRLSGIGIVLVGPILTISGHQKEYMYFLTVMSLVLICALYFAIDRFGLIGAAIATSSVMFLTNCLVFVLVNRMLGLNVFSATEMSRLSESKDGQA